MAFKLGMTVDLCMAYVLILVLMTLTLMQGHSGLAKAKNQHWMLSATKQAISIKLAIIMIIIIGIYNVPFRPDFLWYDMIIMNDNECGMICGMVDWVLKINYL